MYKYQSEIELLLDSGCKMPDGLHNPHNYLVYRYVFADSENINNHKPVYVQNPKRALKNPQTIGYALSCFDDGDKAIENFFNNTKKNKNFVKTVGDSLCSGVLVEDDGEITYPNANGHLSLFEYEGCNLATKFSIIKQL